MIKYIAILRGINVGGQRSIKMADLKKHFEDLSFGNVATYIQSGNVIFDSKEKDRSKIQKMIESVLTQKYGFTVPVLIRSTEDMKRVEITCPFDDIDLESEGTRVLVTFLAQPPKEDKTELLLSYVYAPERLVVKDKEVYLYCPDGYGKTKLSNNFIEARLGVQATSRNWKTICKLNELADG